MMRMTSWIGAAMAVTMAACDPGPSDARPPAQDLTVWMEPHDLATGVGGDVPIVIRLTQHQPWETLEDFVREELPSWHESTRVVRWPSREPVEGRWIFPNDYPLVLTFQPSEPLPRGWYALQVRFSTIVTPRGTATEQSFRSGWAREILDDGWTTSRFHVGSFPIAQVWGRIDPPTEGFVGSGGSFYLFMTEPVILERDQVLEGMLTVTLDGEPLDCPSAQPDGILRATGYPYGGLLWQCSDVPRSGRVVVTLRPLEGAPTSLRYGGRGWPPTWVGETGRRFSARAVDESLFLEEVSP